MGRSRRPSILPCKTVHLAAYGPAERPQGRSFELRIYCVPETRAAMESVSRQEDRGRLLAETDQFILSEKGELCFCVEDLSPGFRLKGPALVVREGLVKSMRSDLQEIAESQHRWCSQNGLHCSIPIAMDDNVSVEQFCARLVIYQKTNPGEDHQILIRFENSIVSESGLENNRELQYDRPPVEEDKVVTVDFHLPAELKDTLGQLLDPPGDSERDWRTLAKKLHFDRYLQVHPPNNDPNIKCVSVLWHSARTVAHSDATRSVGGLRVRLGASCPRSSTDSSGYGKARCRAASGGLSFPFCICRVIIIRCIILPSCRVSIGPQSIFYRLAQFVQKNFAICQLPSIVILTINRKSLVLVLFYQY